MFSKSVNEVLVYMTRGILIDWWLTRHGEYWVSVEASGCEGFGMACLVVEDVGDGVVQTWAHGGGAPLESWGLEFQARDSILPQLQSNVVHPAIDHFYQEQLFHKYSQVSV